MIDRAEQSQYDGPQSLVQQPTQQDANGQGAAPHRQILQEKQPGHLFILQTDEDIGTQLPAAALEHEAGGVGHQPAEHTYHHDAGQHDYHGQHSHALGQGADLLGKHQGVEGVEQGGGHDHGGKIDQIILGLPLGVAQGQLR